MIIQDYPERQIKIIDSEKATVVKGLLILDAAKMKQDNYSLDRVYIRLLEIKDETLIIFTIDTLEYLQKGDRIGKVSSLASSLLNIKSIILLENGILGPYFKFRVRKKL